MSKAARQRTARERLAEERKKQDARQQRVRALVIGVSGIVIVALVVGIGLYFANKKEKRAQVAAAYNGVLAPVKRDADGSVVMAKAGVTAPLLEVFEDFQCPICKRFEDSSGGTLKKLAADGKVKVVYRPFQLFQQDEPTKGNSLRALNASFCVPDDKWISYHDALYKFQPAEDKSGFATKDLTAWGKDVGITDAGFDKCVTDEAKKSLVDSSTKYALDTRKVTGTPTVFLDGKQLSLENQLFTPSAIEKAVADAAAAKK